MMILESTLSKLILYWLSSLRLVPVQVLSRWVGLAAVSLHMLTEVSSTFFKPHPHEQFTDEEAASSFLLFACPGGKGW